MTPSFPPDDALGDLGVLVDEAAMVPQLAALARPGVVVEGCWPVYIRYRPDRTCLVQYDVTLRTPDRPTGQVRTAHVRVFTDDRARKRAGGEKLAALAALAAHGGAPPLPGVAFLPDVAGLLQVHPVDHNLPFLARAVDPAFMTRMFTAAGLHPASAGPAVPEPVRYKPGRKALLHYTPAVGPRLYAKVHPDDRAGRVAAQTAALIGAGITTPAVALARPDHGLVVHAEYAGDALISLRGTPPHRDAIAEAASVLRRFAATPIPDAPRHMLTDEAGLIRSATGWLARVVPELSPRLERLRAALTSGLQAVHDWPVTGHGDFYDDQVVVSREGLSLIDLDDLRLAHPSLDLGNMLAHLRSAGSRGLDVGGAHAQFAEEALRHGPSSARELALFEAAGLIKLAAGPFRRVEPDWRSGIERIVGLAEECLAATGPGGAGRPVA